MLGNVVRRSKGRNDTRWMEFDKKMLRQVKWWRISLSAMHAGGTKIQDPWGKFLFPVDLVLVFSDAAGVVLQEKVNQQCAIFFRSLGWASKVLPLWPLWPPDWLVLSLSIAISCIQTKPKEVKVLSQSFCHLAPFPSL